MSGRSVGNRYMKQHNGTCVVTLQHPHIPSEKLLSHAAWAKPFPVLSVNERQALAEESLNIYLEEYKELRSKLTVPLILLWISARSPNHNKTYDNPAKMLGEFPHFVDTGIRVSLCNLIEHRVIMYSNNFINRPLWSQNKSKKFEIIRPWGRLYSYDASYAHPYLHISIS